MDDEEPIHGNYDENKKENNSELNNNKNKKSRKALHGDPSEERFFSFAHTLLAFKDEIEHLLGTKKFTCVLTEKSNNEPIEHRFSLNTCLGGHRLALDVSTFFNNERTLLLRLV